MPFKHAVLKKLKYVFQTQSQTSKNGFVLPSLIVMKY